MRLGFNLDDFLANFPNQVMLVERCGRVDGQIT